MCRRGGLEWYRAEPVWSKKSADPQTQAPNGFGVEVWSISRRASRLVKSGAARTDRPDW